MDAHARGRPPGAMPAPPRREWAACLPFDVAIGPHHLAVQWRAAAQMHERGRPGCLNLEQGRIELRQDLGGLGLAAAFLGCLIDLGLRRCAVHRNGAGCAHALAAVLVEFALRNPRAWLWFNLLLSEHLPGRPRFDRAARHALVAAPAPPRRIVIGGRVVGLRVLSPSLDGGAHGAYHAQRREVLLPAGLGGSTLPVVALRAITQAIQHVHAVQPGDPPGRYRRAQLEGWLGVMRDSPEAWLWLAWAMTLPVDTRRVAR